MASCYVGEAIIENAIICEAGEDCDKFVFALIGGAKVGCTQVSWMAVWFGKQIKNIQTMFLASRVNVIVWNLKSFLNIE